MQEERVRNRRDSKLPTQHRVCSTRPDSLRENIEIIYVYRISPFPATINRLESAPKRLVNDRREPFVPKSFVNLILIEPVAPALTKLDDECQGRLLRQRLFRSPEYGSLPSLHVNFEDRGSGGEIGQERVHRFHRNGNGFLVRAIRVHVIVGSFRYCKPQRVRRSPNSFIECVNPSLQIILPQVRAQLSERIGHRLQGQAGCPPPAASTV